MPADAYADMCRAEVWPENWDAWCLFDALSTQWRAGPGGVIGLDYGVLAEELRLREIPADQHAQLRSDIRVMEAAALDSLYDDND
ncbi:hypothetical protein D8I35_09425 [Corticibacter populi]|uniref:DUF1799 domain-containing protein n=1 Tax=Corticibacter populi TaxID=1550736 RepID=A0A3M6QUZ3_9BURK|nr:DUF1799 domain-containing protein [Corticibacter populi]RMX06711.1 hypothetical protein D8I35_09425 [Corticibacter populi]RZS31708.1 uncharacterized protein DUF1799 [Corticibacter populi]